MMVRLTTYMILFCIVFPYCLSGPIPKELGQLGALTILWLLANKLEGEGEASEKKIAACGWFSMTAPISGF